MHRISAVLRQSRPQSATTPEHQSEEGSYFNANHSHQDTVAAPRPSVTRKTTITRTDAQGLVPPTDKLLTFRSLTGIDNVPTLSVGGHSARAADNVGIYSRVVASEKKASRRLKLFHWLSNFCLGAQIIVGATLTALGAASGSHTAVTAFGALNTVMAAILTYLKASGIPERFKAHQAQWRRVREHIEQRERELCLADCPLDALEEVAIVEEMYNMAKEDVDAKPMGSSGGGSRDSTVSRRPMSMVHRAALKVAEATEENNKAEPAAHADAGAAERAKAES